jgi:flagellar protein FliO/FliZ
VRTPRLISGLVAIVLLCPASLLAAGETEEAPVALVTRPAAVAPNLSATVQSSGEIAGMITSMVSSLLLIVVLIWLLAWLARKVHNAQAPVGGAMRLLGGLAVGQRERVVLIQVGERQLLLGVAPGRVEMLYALEEPLPVSGEGETAQQFSRHLAALIARTRREEPK